MKFVVGCLVLITAVSAYQFFVSFEFEDLSSANVAVSTDGEPPTTDIDQDGLSDTDESVWGTDFNDSDSDDDGFLDGEEVASGHDPMIPGPNDSIIGQNLTEKTTDLLAAGFITQDLKKDKVGKSAYDERMDTITLASIEDYYKGQLPPEVDLTQTDGNKSSQEQYLEALSRIFQDDVLNFEPNEQNFPDTVSAQIRYFTKRATEFKELHTRIQKMPVPEGWITVHQGILNVAFQVQTDYHSLSQIETDPVRATIALNDLRVMVTPTVQEILKDVQNKIKENGLSPSADFYKMITLLYQ